MNNDNNYSLYNYELESPLIEPVDVREGQFQDEILDQELESFYPNENEADDYTEHEINNEALVGVELEDFYNEGLEYDIDEAENFNEEYLASEDLVVGQEIEEDESIDSDMFYDEALDRKAYDMDYEQMESFDDSELVLEVEETLDDNIENEAFLNEMFEDLNGETYESIDDDIDRNEFFNEESLSNEILEQENRMGYDEGRDLYIEEETAENLGSLVQNIISVANAEYSKWDYGKLQETQAEAKVYLEKYWKYGTNANTSRAARLIRRRSPWSAAFISYVIYQAGGVPPFKKSGGHYVYAAQAKKNRAQKRHQNPISMWLYKIHEVKPQPGDILFNARVDKINESRNGANFDNIDNGNYWATHSDLIIGTDENYITVIGGNTCHRVNGRKICDTVAKKRVQLDGSGHVKLKGIRLKEYFGIVRFFAPNQQPSAPVQKNSSIISLFKKIGLGVYDFGQMSLRLFSALSAGKNENILTNIVFYYKYPSKKGQKLKRGEPLAKEWIKIRNLLIRPLLSGQEVASASSIGGLAGTFTSNDNGPSTSTDSSISNRAENLTAIPDSLGELRINSSVPELSNSIPSYKFTKEDALWMARFVTGESGVKNDANGHAVLWTMFNRFGMLRHRVKSWSSFQRYLRLYSTTLQPILLNKGAAQRVWRNHKRNPDKFPVVRGTGTYKGTDIRRVQYQKHVDLQRKKWEDIHPAVRGMVINILRGYIPNPGIGIATEFASTRIYFKQKYGRYPKSREEWRKFTVDYAQNRCKRKMKGCTWIGTKRNLDQMKNAFFIDNRFRNVPPSAIKIIFNS